MSDVTKEEMLECFDGMCHFLAIHGISAVDPRAVAIRSLIESLDKPEPEGEAGVDFCVRCDSMKRADGFSKFCSRCQNDLGICDPIWEKQNSEDDRIIKPEKVDTTGEDFIEGIDMRKSHDKMTEHEVRTEYLRVKALCIRLWKQLRSSPSRPTVTREDILEDLCTRCVLLAESQVDDDSDIIKWFTDREIEVK